MKPTHLLEKLCHHYHLDLPQYEGNTVMVANSKFSGMLSKEGERVINFNPYLVQVVMSVAL